MVDMPGDAAARAEAKRVADAANAIVASMNSDDVVILAQGLVAAAAVMAGLNPAGKTAVAISMLENAFLLDPDLVMAPRQWQ